MNRFITPVSMKVTLNQYIRDIQEPLIVSGYKEMADIERRLGDQKEILCTDWDNRNRYVGVGHDTQDDRYFIDYYNPDLFLALASMTRADNISIWEYVVCDEIFKWVRRKHLGIPTKIMSYKKPYLFGYAYSIQNPLNQKEIKGLICAYHKASKEELVRYFSAPN